MIREDEENVLECSCSRYYIIPMDKMADLMGIPEKLDEFGMDERDCEVTRKVFAAGGDFVNLETGEVNADPVKIVKKYRVDADGNNEAIIEIRANIKSNAHRFLMKGELTREEYVFKRTKELGLNGSELIKNLEKLHEEYKQLTAS
jgi:hypothetical protein